MRKEREHWEDEKVKGERKEEELRQKIDTVEHERAKLRSDISVLREQAIDRERKLDECHTQVKEAHRKIEAATILKREHAYLQD